MTGYHTVRIGPYLRREKSKRRYADYFTFQKSIVGERFDSWKVKRMQRKYNLYDDPKLGVLEDCSGSVYNFNPKIKWNDFFEGLKSHRALVIELFWSFLSEKYEAELAKCKAPVIGVHIRMGDFRKLQENEVFREVGGVRTPEQYFIDIIHSIRSIHGSELAVSIFTDGYAHEISGILKMNNVSFVEGNSDIVDLLLLSKSSIIVSSAGSTFSYWAGFLSNAPVIMHPDHIHLPIRCSLNNDLYEGPLDLTNEILLRQIRAIPMTIEAI